MHSMKAKPLSRQRGITLIESLVAIVISALGILGILGVQMRTLTDTQTTVRRAQAIRLIEDLSERMKVNPNALADLQAYTSAFNNQPAAGDCQTQACSHTQLAAYDLGIWKQSVSNTLPLGQANIFLASGESVDANRRQLGVMISWRENEKNIANANDKALYKDNIDATKIRDSATGALSAGSDQSCPANRVCHLQYIAVAARCAPYLGGGTTQFFCPGA
ncbi:type IV pilus modification protein PilV [Comamonas testosteroni]|uniref:type IV pilus modification protein PilV n=1 Tax=Comamonas testosteroni TaxID=285 RepID=UPI0005B31187|nr:type IV pilus modification protein PilV [Comamonas testosteroni]